MSENDEVPQSITVIRDERGIAFLGEPASIKQWLDERGMTSREFKVKAAKVASSAIQATNKSAMESGRWVKLTKESAELLKKYGSKGAVQPGVVRDEAGKIVKWLKFEKPGDLFSPAMATGVAGVMTQMALEQAIQEITDYLAAIDEKVNDLLQDQKDRVIADLMGAVFEVDEAAAIRDRTGTLGDAAWSKVAPCAQTTGTALAYALTKLQGISDKLGKSGSVEDVSHVLDLAQDDTKAWLMVIARAVQTRDRLSVVELERAFAENPLVLEEHRVAIIEARDDRLRKVQNRVGDLQSVFEQTADRVRGEKLLHPFTVDKVLSQLNDLTSQTCAFSKHLDIEIERKPIERAPGWGEVAGKFVGDVANGAAEGAQQLGGAIAEGAGALGDAAGKGAMDLGSAVADGAQELGKALGSIDLGRVAEAIPFKFPFGK